MKKLLSSAFLTVTIMLGLVLVSVVRFETAHASTNVTGIIPSDATWTKANSPYILMGNVLISNGVTLTIEAGATVNLGSYYIMVNGTLRARGTTADMIQFSSGSISFTDFGMNWNDTTGTGSIIDDANLSTTELDIYSASPKISNSVLGIVLSYGSSTFSNNVINGRLPIGGSPSLLNNTINGEVITSSSSTPTISYNFISGRLFISGPTSSSIIISHNTISGGVEIGVGVYSPLISHNSILGGLNVSGASSQISYNSITGGVSVRTYALTILNNTISGANTGIDFAASYPENNTPSLISNNTIFARNIGISFPGSYNGFLMGYWTDAIITGNTISNCSTAAIQVGGATSQGGYSDRYNNVTIQGNLLSGNGYAVKSQGMSKVEGNTIMNNYYGVNTGNPVRNNIIANNTYGIIYSSTIDSNLIVNNRWGIVWGGDIRNNTIVNNTVGVQDQFATLVYNNIYGNALNVNFTSSADGNATYNWWGTTNTATINQTIYDYKNDFRFGRVNFVPMLTSPNPAAPSANTPIPPVIPEFENAIIMAVILLATTLMITVGLLRKKNR